MAEWTQASDELTLATHGKGFTEITRDLSRWLESIPAESGLLTLFVRHTSASLTIQENADPNVRVDLLDVLGLSGDPDALTIARRLQQDADPAAARAARRAVMRLQGSDPPSL